MIKQGKLFYLGANADTRWARGNKTLPGRMTEVNEEFPWHAVLMGGEDDVVILPKSWPQDFPLPHKTLGLSAPTLLAPRGITKASLRQLPFTPLTPLTPLTFSPFCADEWSQAWADKISAKVSNLPDPQVVRKVNGRAFSLAVEKSLPGALSGWQAHLGCVVQNWGEVLAALAERKWNQAMLKGQHGQAGNANTKISLSDEDASYRLAQGILQWGQGGVLEEWHSIEGEFAWQYELSSQGEISQARGHRLLTTRMGHYLGVLMGPSSIMPHAMEKAFVAAAKASTHALHQAGYWGPVGHDGYAYTREEALNDEGLNDGRRYYRPLSDLNARMTMATPAHITYRRIQELRGGQAFYMAWLFLPAKPRLIMLSMQARQAALGEHAFSHSTWTGALWLTPSHDSDGKAAQRHSLLLLHDDLMTLESWVAYFRDWALNPSLSRF